MTSWTEGRAGQSNRIRGSFRAVAAVGFPGNLPRIPLAEYLLERMDRRAPIDGHERDELIAHLRWIRDLARRIASDPDRADDLAQETCVVALEADSRDPLFRKGWLRTVMQNLARRQGARERTRREHEASAARREPFDATDALVERAGLQREIVDAVLALEEPYRSAILLRFFEELPPRAIAKRLGVPVATVQSRLTRGLRRLRERLDDARGDRRSWPALIAPLAGSRDSFLATLGGSIVNAKTILVATSIAALATWVALTHLGESAPEAAGSKRRISLESEARESGKRDESALAVAGEAAGSERVAASTPAPPAAAAPAPSTAPGSHHVRGRVFEAEGSPVGGIALVFEGGDERVEVRSQAGGWFELDTTAATGSIAANDGTLATVRRGLFRAKSSFEPIVIVAPAIDVGGLVLDPQRTPLQGARVALALPAGFETRIGQVLDSTRVLQWPALTDGEGRFVLNRVPAVGGSTLRVLMDGYTPGVQPEPMSSDPGLVFVLQRPVVLSQGALRGRVLDPDGHLVPGARVATGVTSTVTDERGEFVLDLSRALTADRVTAVKEGYRPAALDRPDEPHGDDTGWPGFVELRLGGPPLSIVGHVIDHEGHPREGVRVWIADPTPFGLIGRMPAQSENLMAGATIPTEALEPDTSTAPPVDSDAVTTQRKAGAPPTACWNWVVADSDGRFEIGGLDDRDYRVRVLDTKTLQRVESDAIRAGDHQARVRMPPPKVFERLAGRVSTIGDRSLAGVRLQLRTTSFEVNTRYIGGTLNVQMMNAGAETTTDADGRFEFKDVPRSDVFLVLRSDRIVPCDWHLPEGADPENLEVRVDARCQFEVRLKAPVDRADSLVLLDEDGQEVDVITLDENTVSLESSAPLVAGRSGVLSTSSAARTLELRKDGVLVERSPISLVPNEILLVER